MVATVVLRDRVHARGRVGWSPPVLWPGASDRSVYLPPGPWVDYWTGAPFAGGRSHRVAVTLRSIPIFVRAGAFVFEHPVVQHTGELRGQAERGVDEGLVSGVFGGLLLLSWSNPYQYGLKLSISELGCSLRGAN